MIEEVHACLEFQYIYFAAHNTPYVLALMQQQGLTTLAEAFAKHGMGKIGLSLTYPVKTIEI